jgi:hypothetical protein
MRMLTVYITCTKLIYLFLLNNKFEVYVIRQKLGQQVQQSQSAKEIPSAQFGP